jgi:Spy/CpxP family protein refolding chaperone
MKTNPIKKAGVFLLAILMLASLNAQPNPNGNRGMAYGNREGRAANLDLTEAQSEQITQLRTEHYTTMKPLRAKMAEMKAKERTLLSEESVDLKAVEEVIDQQTELLNQMRKLQTKHQLAIKEVLTDEQVMKLEQRQSFRMGQDQTGRGQRPGTGYGRGYSRGYDRGYDRGYGRYGRSI